MKPVKTEHTNANFTKDGCESLPGTTYKYDDGNAGVETVWELSDEELELLKQGRRVYLYTLGSVLPPMFMAAESQLIFPNKDENTGGATHNE